MTPQHVGDISPGGTAQPILPAPRTIAYRVLLLASDASARFGDSGINVGGGCKIGTTIPLDLSFDFEDGGVDLSQLYVWASTGTISVTYFA